MVNLLVVAGHVFDHRDLDWLAVAVRAASGHPFLQRLTVQ